MLGQRTLDPVIGKEFVPVHPPKYAPVHLFPHSKEFLAMTQQKRTHSMMNACMRSG